MPKLNYCDALERLSVLSSRAVFLACTPQKQNAQSEMFALRHSADRGVCELETSLFSEFMPPLERGSIAVCAHSILRVMERCSDIINYRYAKNFLTKEKFKECEICIKLMQAVEENIFSLRKIKKPSELPDLQGFRKLLFDAAASHAYQQKKLYSGIYPKSCQQLIILNGALRCELSACFDCTVEIMLDNI